MTNHQYEINPRTNHSLQGKVAGKKTLSSHIVQRQREQ
jgi:hypothetical protein